MGDRSGVIFVDETGEESVVLVDHWGGTQLHELAGEFVRERAKLNIERGDVQEAMADFVQWYLNKTEQITNGHASHTVYLGRTTQEVDDSDQGTLRIKLITKQ